jgi:hypothetical protein
VNKWNKKLYDNCIEYFMVWIQICVVVYMCNVVHKKNCAIQNCYIVSLDF